MIDLIDDFFKDIIPSPDLELHYGWNEVVDIYEAGCCWVLGMAGYKVGNYQIYEAGEWMHCFNYHNGMTFDIRGWRSLDDFKSQWVNNIHPCSSDRTKTWLRIGPEAYSLFEAPIEMIKSYALWFVSENLR